MLEDLKDEGFVGPEGECWEDEKAEVKREKDREGGEGKCKVVCLRSLDGLGLLMKSDRVRCSPFLKPPSSSDSSSLSPSLARLLFTFGTPCNDAKRDYPSNTYLILISYREVSLINYWNFLVR